MAKRVLTTAAGVVYGLVCGWILGVLLGGILDLIIGQWFGWRWLFGGVIGVATGLIAGAGIGLLWVRTRECLEFDYSRNWNAWSELLELTGPSALAGWLSALIVRAVLGNWLSAELFQYWMAVGCIALFAAWMFGVPRFLRVVMLTISP